MGQYYKPVLYYGGKAHIYSRNVNGEHTMAKLTEHSWWGNYCCEAISEIIYNEFKNYKQTCNLAWVGDYAEPQELKDANKDFPEFEKVWDSDENDEDLEFKNLNFDLMGKYIVNVSKHEYLDCTEYYKNSKHPSLDMVSHPLPLLTAIGNQRGGGDYYGQYEEYIGRWAGDHIYITDERERALEFDKLDVAFVKGKSFSKLL